MRQVTFEPNTCIPRAIGKRRVGKKRDNWIAYTMSEAFDTLVPPEFRGLDLQNEYELRWVEEAAKRREGVFATKAKGMRVEDICRIENEILDRDE